MRRLLPLIALCVLSACGSGGGGAAPAGPDPLTLVSLVDSLPIGYEANFGLTEWDEDGVATISLLRGAVTDNPLWRQALLRHEIWHLLTRRSDHPNDANAMCVSAGDFLRNPPIPCPEEVAQANAANRVVTISFPDDLPCAHVSAAWWNAGLGREAVLVVESSPP